MKAKLFLFLLGAFFFTSGMNAQIYKGQYTQKSRGQSTYTGQYMEVKEKLFDIEIYNNYIVVNGTRADYFFDAKAGMTTLTPGSTRKSYKMKISDDFLVLFMIDSIYNMEISYIFYNTRTNKISDLYLFPVTKGNTLSSSNTGGYSDSGSSSPKTRTATITHTKCPDCTKGRRVVNIKRQIAPTTRRSNREEESTDSYSRTKIWYSTCSECGHRYQSLHWIHRHELCNTCHGSGFLD